VKATIPFLCAAAVVACSRPAPERAMEPPAAPAASAARAPLAVTLPERLARRPAERLVAVGDLHGDLDAARRALRLAGAIDARDAWIGGKLVVVQTGDQIDRGDDDRAVLDLFEALKGSAKDAGGEVIPLDGNHELMNVAQDFRYVTPGSLAAFRDAGRGGTDGRARAAAFEPGAAYARLLAQRPIFVDVGGTVFVHGGVLEKHVTYGLARMDDEVRSWLLGQTPTPPRVVMGEDGPVWTRAYSAAPGKDECAELARVLERLGARRMVMGHTVQRGGVSSACEGKAWRIDVGMSRVFGGPVQVLQIRGDDVTVLSESAVSGDARR